MLQTFKTHFLKAWRGEEKFSVIFFVWGVMGWTLWLLFVALLLFAADIIGKLVGMPSDFYERCIILFLWLLLQVYPSLTLFFLWKWFGNLRAIATYLLRTTLVISYIIWLLVVASFSYIVMVLTMSV